LIKLLLFLNSLRIPANYRSFVYCTAIKYGSINYWELAYNQYINENDINHQIALQESLSCTKEPWLLSRFLNDQINETKVKKNDGIVGINHAIESPYSKSITWNFIKQNWNILQAR
jgi:aminopeptidase N